MQGFDDQLMSIRPAQPEDAESFVTIHRSAILASAGTVYTSAECESWAYGLHAGQYTDAMTEKGERFLVADRAGTPVGFCSFKNDEVVGLYIEPRFARRGLGSALLVAAERKILAQGGLRIRLKAALSAKDFYVERGYVVMETTTWISRGGLELKILAMEKSY